MGGRLAILLIPPLSFYQSWAPATQECRLPEKPFSGAATPGPPYTGPRS